MTAPDPQPEQVVSDEDEAGLPYALMDAVARADGWDDLEMDSYNAYSLAPPDTAGRARGSSGAPLPSEGKLLQGGNPVPNPLEWSPAMENLFWTSVGKVILDDPRTDWSESLSLGYPFDVIREQVLQKGLADFSQGHDDPRYGRLTPDEKALLYCFVNFKKHFFAALATFQEHRAPVEDLFGSGEKPLLLDIGCGPATACLALADLLPGRNFEYLGIDSAAPMRTKAKSLWEAAVAKGLIGRDPTETFRESWTDLAPEQIAPARSVLVVFSYCCASHTLTLKVLQSLAHTILKIVSTRTGKPLVLAYMNSTNPLANINYEVFKDALGLDVRASAPAPVTIEYRKKRGGTALGRDEFVREVLRIQRRA